MDPWYVVGLVEGEGCFSLAINKRPDLNIGWDHRPLFCVSLDCKGTDLMEQVLRILKLPDHFLTKNCHTKTPLDGIMVQNVKYLVENIIPFFEKYPFFGPKKKQFECWKKGVMLKYNCKKPCREVMEAYLQVREEIQMSTKSKRKYKYSEIILTDGTTIGKNKEKE